MPKRATYVLRQRAQSPEYVVHAGDAPLLPGVAPDTPAWFAWLDTVTSFAFESASATVARCARRRCSAAERIGMPIGASRGGWRSAIWAVART